jgi:hypothetical protein
VKAFRTKDLVQQRKQHGMIHWDRELDMTQVAFSKRKGEGLGLGLGEKDETRQHEARQGKARQDTTRQD